MTVTTLRTSPDSLILKLLCERSQASAASIGTACRVAPGDVRSRLAHLESLRLITSRQDRGATPPVRVYAITSEGRRMAKR